MTGNKANSHASSCHPTNKTAEWNYLNVIISEILRFFETSPKTIVLYMEKERIHTSETPLMEAGGLTFGWSSCQVVQKRKKRRLSELESFATGCKCGLKASKVWLSSGLVTMILGTIQAQSKRKTRSSSAVS